MSSQGLDARCAALLEELWAADVDEVFRNPVSPSDFEEGGWDAYCKTVSRHTSLIAASSALRSSGDVYAFLDDLHTMFDNCEAFNRPHCDGGKRCECVACYGSKLRKVFLAKRQELFPVTSFERCGLTAGRNLAAHVGGMPLVVYGRVIGFRRVDGEDVMCYDPATVLNFNMRRGSEFAVVPNAGCSLEPVGAPPVHEVRFGPGLDGKTHLPPPARIWNEQDTVLNCWAIIAFRTILLHNYRRCDI